MGEGEREEWGAPHHLTKAGIVPSYTSAATTTTHNSAQESAMHQLPLKVKKRAPEKHTKDSSSSLNGSLFEAVVPSKSPGLKLIKRFLLGHLLPISIVV